MRMEPFHYSPKLIETVEEALVFVGRPPARVHLALPTVVVVASAVVGFVPVVLLVAFAAIVIAVVAAATIAISIGLGAGGTVAPG